MSEVQTPVSPSELVLYRCERPDWTLHLMSRSLVLIAKRGQRVSRHITVAHDAVAAVEDIRITRHPVWVLGLIFLCLAAAATAQAIAFAQTAPNSFAVTTYTQLAVAAGVVGLVLVLVRTTRKELALLSPSGFRWHVWPFPAENADEWANALRTWIRSGPTADGLTG